MTTKAKHLDTDGELTISVFSNGSNLSDMKNMMGNLAFNNDGISSAKGSASMMQNDNKKPAARNHCFFFLYNTKIPKKMKMWNRIQKENIIEFKGEPSVRWRDRKSVV